MAGIGWLSQRDAAQTSEKTPRKSAGSRRRVAWCFERSLQKIKRRKQVYRLVYGFQDDILMVMVMAFDKREDSAVYQAAMARISELISELSNVTPKRH